MAQTHVLDMMKTAAMEMERLNPEALPTINWPAELKGKKAGYDQDEMEYYLSCMVELNFIMVTGGMIYII